MICKESANTFGGISRSAFRTPQSGIALVITLILLSVTLVMAVAFLAISRRERASVTTETDATTARLAADAALSHAEQQIIANLLISSNAYNYGFLVSTNYINAFGVTNGSPDLLNVSYNYYPSGAFVSQADFLQTVANLFYSPRVPVFIQTNANGLSDFRFYLDLNRNGLFDDSGMVSNVFLNSSGAPFVDGTTTFRQGDPQWIGILTRPDTRHGPDNLFASRYAFAAIPIGNTMDINYVHNQTITRAVNSSPSAFVSDGFFRNESVGSWEINLAAFFADLNTNLNKWGYLVGSGASSPVGSGTYYQYNEPYSVANQGNAFDDARALLSWRYGFNYNSLASLQAVGGAGAYSQYQWGMIDLYTIGSWMTNTALQFPFIAAANTAWVGADNTNRFFDLTSDLFDSTKSSAAFVNRLQSASTNVDTYSRYAFNRLLSELGTDSEPDTDKMNVDYINLDTNGNVVVNMETNMIPWTNSLAFFTNAADRLLRAYSAQWFRENPSNYLATYYGIIDPYPITNDVYGNVTGLTNALLGTNQPLSFGLYNIPVLISNKFVYSASVNRLLQLAANIFDATTNAFYPSVFRPIFEQDYNYNLFIAGFTNVQSVIDASDPQLRLPQDAREISVNYPTYISVPIVDSFGYINIYGVPWIIGAKKGFPNFNEFAMNNVVQATRKVQIKRHDWSFPPVFDYTNQMYVLSVGSSLGIEFWNSYFTNYPGKADVIVRERIAVAITNSFGTVLYSSGGVLPASTGGYFQVLTNEFIFDPTVNAPWRGSGFWQGSPMKGNPDPVSFASQKTNFMILTNVTVTLPYGNPFLPAVAGNWANIAVNQFFPHIHLVITNHLQSFILDGTHVIDYIQLNGPDSSRDLEEEIRTVGSAQSYDNMWSTNIYPANNVPVGIFNQILASKDDASIPVTGNGTYWKSGTLQNWEIDGFYVFMGGSASALPIKLTTAAETNKFNAYLTNLVHQTPFTPTVTAWDYTTWQVNDPLVHYQTTDLNFSETDIKPPTGISRSFIPGEGYFLGTENIGQLNLRYAPWGRQYVNANSTNQPFSLSTKDPRVFDSDYWDFPTNKLPSVGWLGRIHRGTPWQTVYLKSPNVLTATNSFGDNIGVNAWTNWTGSADAFDAVNDAPGQDRILFDLFTAAPADNATRGQLSVNVEAGNTNDPAAGLAAWSAVFSGMAVPMTLTNTYAIINPAGVDQLNSALWQMVTNINEVRAHFTNTDGTVGVFEHVGDIFAVPRLTAQSPFLDWFAAQNDTGTGGNLNDELYEWLPQQALPLLKVSKAPRYVIYCYGQALKPAPNSLVTSSQFFGMCTNYAPVAETAIRAVIRVEDAKTQHPHIVVESYNVLPPD